MEIVRGLCLVLSTENGVILKLIIDNNLKLKLLEPEDSKKLFELTDQNREHLREWLPWLDFNKEEADSLNFIKMTMKQTKDNQGYQFGIWKNNEICGIVGHHKIDWSNKTTSLGYWLGKDFSGQGIITRACKKLMEYSFKDLSLNCVVIGAATENKKSRAVIERLGCTFEGALRQREWLYDHYVDHATYSMLASEWEKLEHKI